MHINMNKFIDMFDQLCYDFKQEKHLDYISNSLSYAFNLEASHLDEDSESDLLVMLEAVMKKSLMQDSYQFQKLQSEENVNELVERAIRNVREQFDYFTSNLMYGKYPVEKYLDYNDSSISSCYTEVKNPNDWLECPHCGLKPLVWIYNNGATARCGCEKGIHAEAIYSVYERTGKSMKVPIRMGWDASAIIIGVLFGAIPVIGVILMTLFLGPVIGAVGKVMGNEN